MQTQYITDNEGKKVAVIIGIDEYERIHERLEELEDVLLYDQMKPDADSAIREGRFKTLEQLKQDLQDY
ncbi:MAG: hypothetical protein CL946_13420 [Ectothiorhodospiraceae bacterium]|nr:hypothetical protein [Ectothiorhodospiraceae bacterium]